MRGVLLGVGALLGCIAVVAYDMAMAVRDYQSGRFYE